MIRKKTCGSWDSTIILYTHQRRALEMTFQVVGFCFFFTCVLLILPLEVKQTVSQGEKKKRKSWRHSVATWHRASRWRCGPHEYQPGRALAASTWPLDVHTSCFHYDKRRREGFCWTSTPSLLSLNRRRWRSVTASSRTKSNQQQQWSCEASTVHFKLLDCRVGLTFLSKQWRRKRLFVLRTQNKTSWRPHLKNIYTYIYIYF